MTRKLPPWAAEFIAFRKSSDLSGFRRQLTNVVRDNQYDYVLRITASGAGLMDLKLAKKAGASVCVARSSNSGSDGGIKSFLAHRIGRLLYSRYIDVRIAPSDLAAIYTFGRRAYQRGAGQNPSQRARSGCVPL